MKVQNTERKTHKGNCANCSKQQLVHERNVGRYPP